jgi:hypothetical protein
MVVEEKLFKLAKSDLVFDTDMMVRKKFWASFFSIE